MAAHRLVFYIAGFDPRGPAREHRDYREAAAQRPTSPDGEAVTVGPRDKVSPVLERWAVDWRNAQGQQWRNWHGVLRWDDLVRRHWPKRWRQSVEDQRNVYWRAGRTGIFAKVRRHAPAAFWLAMFPLGLGLALALPFGAAAWWAGLSLGLAGWCLAPLIVLMWWWSWRRLSLAVDAEWLLRLYGLFWHLSQDDLPDLEARLDAWADAVIASVRAEPCSELLLVGHSAGTPFVAALGARLLRRAAEWAPDPERPSLSLLTLGQCVPILAWLPAAEGFRRDLQALVSQPGVTWHDLSAPADWAAFARVPPWLDFSGPARCAQMSPRFHSTMSPAAYRALLGRRHELHLQYLRAPQRGGGYDPVVWMAGPMTLAERHATLFPSPAPA